MITNNQYGVLRRAMNEVNNISEASRIADMHRNTAGKYLKAGELPSKLKKPRGCVLAQASAIDDIHWEELAKILDASPELEATAAMEFLCERYPDRYTGKELRSLQRRIRDWWIVSCKEKEVMFWQNYRPGERSQSDFIDMDYLRIKIAGRQFDHLLYHFMLPYSGWEYVLICEGGESFMNLCTGCEKAFWKLGGVTKQHRTDNLTAAVTTTPEGSYFTDNWKKLTSHYNVEPTTNNPGKSNENGKVERSNGSIKRSIENHLYLRGSKDFRSKNEYQNFVGNIVEKRNAKREEKAKEERQELQMLPDAKWYSPVKIPVKVHKDSTVRIDGAIYSAPSRTIGSTLYAYLYPDKVDLYYGAVQLETMPRHKKGEKCINFMHIVHSLKQKPGAFEDYKYKDSMYPTTVFRMAYDKLKSSTNMLQCNKDYIDLLYLAKTHNLRSISSAIFAVLKEGALPTSEEIIKRLEHKTPSFDVYVQQPTLSEYDELLTYDA
jgi:hypothetical protein